jgi:hypothetical protein
MHPAESRYPDFKAPAPTLYRPPEEGENRASWRINGFRASIIVWTTEEWRRLAVRPTDAQYYPCGVWCALRLEE